MANGQDFFNTMAAEGFDTFGMLGAIAGHLRPDPLTGKFGQREVEEAISMCTLPDLMKHFEGAAKILDKLKARDLSSYDFTSLEVQVNTAWLIKLDYSGLVDPSKRVLHTATGDRRPGPRPYFFLTCTAMSQTEGPEQTTRWAEEYPGLPDSAAVLDFIRHAIATPYAAMPSCLPEGLFLTLNLRPHEPALRPFLDSLPAPFKWHIETPATAELHSEIAMAGREDRFATYVAGARKAKEAGNAAFAQKDRYGAVKLYLDAMDLGKRALDEKASEESVQRERVRNLLAVCAANCAAAYLLEGEGMNAESALVSGGIAETMDKDYVKGYYRQARAHELLGDLDKAIEVMERARARPNIVEKSGIEDYLAELELRKSEGVKQ
ncbi:hypothetical protein BV25DRAFT_1821514 [Artomyces pyxidatus]|uniref:Uncharacterized protein n=1 Tax=Artomyces pyxidatus TaxID=48021 RepID=A0ACB8TBP1_9AGAM|nr:hypothetical protein BV25DRAFT_1821514 [Artomyces pyxidatus]